MFSLIKRWTSSRTSKLEGIKLVVCDLDGTLLNKQGDVFDSSMQYISNLRQKGVDFVVATGRTHHSAFDVYELLGIESECIAYDGAVIAESLTSMRSVHHVNSELTVQLAVLCQELGLSVTAVDASCLRSFGHPYTPDYLHHQNMELLAVDSISELFAYPALRYYFSSSRASIEQAEKRCVQIDALPKLKCHSWDSRRGSGSTILEVRPSEVDKGSALSRLVQDRLLKDSEVAVVGDYRNDLPMFKKTYFCVALSNAVAELRAVSDLVTNQSSDNAGIDEFLSLLLQSKY